MRSIYRIYTKHLITLSFIDNYQVITNDIKVTKVITFSLNGKLHRIGGPAVLIKDHNYKRFYLYNDVYSDYSVHGNESDYWRICYKVKSEKDYWRVCSNAFNL